MYTAAMVLVSSLLFLSCDREQVYDTYHTVDNKGWHRHDTLVFNPQISDTALLYNLIIKVRHNTGYRYRNLFLFTRTRFPDGGFTRDTIELMLAKKDGEWLGRGYGAIRTTRQMILQQARFRHEGTYTFELNQAMRTDSLRGIEDIGIRIEKYN